jgi:micrococcal nuclease
VRHPRTKVLLALVLTFCLQISLAAAAELVTVKRVTDGDTVELANGRPVRYIGVDTPEIDHASKTAQPFGHEARSFNVELVEGKPVRLEYDLERRDSHGRTLAYVFLPDGSMVNERLLLAGLAFFLYKAPNTRYEDRLLAAQRRAMLEGRGMWRNWHETESRYIGNANTRRFHLPGCPEARRVSARNRVLFTTRWEPFRMGYAPARECLPLGYVPR